jgi:HlyD family secretion protein
VITEIRAQEGSRVAKGDVIMVLDDRKVRQQYLQQKALVEQATWNLKELESGPRSQDIKEAKARVEAAKSTMENDREIFNRQKQLVEKSLTSKQKFDTSRSNYIRSKERVNELAEALDELQEGTRKEQVEQARAQLAALKAQFTGYQLLLDEYNITAAQAGLVESLPFKQGDRPPAGAVVCTVLAGDRPWARVYVPEPYRSQIQPGEEFTVKVDGQAETFRAKLRTIAADASFSPYYGLTERDRSRLAYVAQLDLLDEKSRDLTAGTPVQLVLEQQ